MIIFRDENLLKKKVSCPAHDPVNKKKVLLKKKIFFIFNNKFEQKFTTNIIFYV